MWPPLINSNSFMQTLTNQKSRTVSSWLLIGPICTKNVNTSKASSNVWAPCCNLVNLLSSFVINFCYFTARVCLPCIFLYSFHFYLWCIWENRSLPAGLFQICTKYRNFLLKPKLLFWCLLLLFYFSLLLFSMRDNKSLELEKEVLIKFWR